MEQEEPPRCDCGLLATAAGLCSECYICDHADLKIEMMKLRGMIWWLASDLAADDGDPNSTTETWVESAERHWRLGLRFESRPLAPSTLSDKS